jgi:hypothetical protein
LVDAYHEARLGDLVEHVAEAVDCFRAGENDAFAIHEVLHQYQRAARVTLNSPTPGEPPLTARRRRRLTLRQDGSSSTSRRSSTGGAGAARSFLPLVPMATNTKR